MKLMRGHMKLMGGGYEIDRGGGYEIDGRRL